MLVELGPGENNTSRALGLVRPEYMAKRERMPRTPSYCLDTTTPVPQQYVKYKKKLQLEVVYLVYAATNTGGT